MALVLSMRAGHDFYVGDRRVVVSWIDSPFRFGLKLDDGGHISLTDDKWETVFPGVRMQAGIPRNQDATNLVRVVIDAPDIPIVRGSLYRKPSEATGECETCHGKGTLKSKAPCAACGGHGCSSCQGTGQVTSTFKCPDCGE